MKNISKVKAGDTIFGDSIVDVRKALNKRKLTIRRTGTVTNIRTGKCQTVYKVYKLKG